MWRSVSADGFQKTSYSLNYPHSLIVSVRSLIVSDPPISFVVTDQLFVAAAPLPLALAALATERAPATVAAAAAAAWISVVVAEPAPPMDPENHPKGWTPSVAAAQFALPLLPIEISAVDSAAAAVAPTDPPVTATVRLTSAAEAGFAAPLLPQLPVSLLLL